MPVTSIVWSPDGKYIAASSTQGNKIHVWDVEKKKRVHEFERTAAAPFFNELSWSSSGRYLAACDGYRGGLRLYDIHSWQAAHLIQPIREKRCVASTFSRDGQELAVLGESISFYSTDDWRLLRFVDLPNSVSHGVPYRFRVIGYVSQSHTILIGGDRRDGSNGFKVALGHVWVLDASDEIPRAGLPSLQGGAAEHIREPYQSCHKSGWRAGCYWYDHRRWLGGVGFCNRFRSHSSSE